MDLQFNSGNRNPSDKPIGIFATVFLILFATLFAGLGLCALVVGIRKTIAGDLANGLPIGLVGLVFSIVGFGLMFAAILGRKKLKQAIERQTLHADEPWRLRADWAAGKIK